MNLLKKLFGINTKINKPLVERLEASREAANREDYEHALSILESAKELVDDDQLRHRIDLNAVLMQIDSGLLDEAKQLLDNLEFVTSNNNDDRILWLWVAGRLAHASGEWEQAREHYQTVREMAKSTNNIRFGGRASAYLADIYLHDENASFAIHLLKIAIKQLEQVDDGQYQSYVVGKLGEAHIASQQKQEGLPLLQRALRVAERLNQQRFIRQWQLALGIFHLQEHQYETAYGYLRTVIKNYPEKRKDSDEYVQGLCWLSYASRYLDAEDQPEVYAREAVNRSSNLDNQSLVIFSNAILGLVLFDAKDHVEALPLIEQAVEQGAANKQLFSHELLIELMRRQASIESENDIEKAASTYKKALDLANQHDLGHTAAQVQVEFGQLFWREKQYSQAIQNWKLAIKQFEMEHDNIQAARLLCDLMQLQLMTGQEIRALHAIEQALQLLNLIDDPITRGVILSNAAMFYAEYGEIKTAEEFFVEAIENAKTLQNPIAEANRRANYGWLILNIGRIERAQLELKTSLELCQQNNLSVQAAIVRNNLGLAAASLADYEIAVDYQQAALDEIRQHSEEVWQILIQLDFAKTLMSANQPDEAKIHVDDVLEPARKTQLMPLIMRALIAKTNHALATNQLIDAENTLDEITTYAQRIQSRRLQMAILTTQSRYFAAKNQMDSAREKWLEAEKLFDLMQKPKPTIDWLSDEST